MLRGCLVCAICNSNSIHSFIFKLCIMIVHTLKMCTLYFIHISWIFFYFFGVLNIDIFSLEKLRWFLFCVICNSKSFHSLLFKLCIMIVHTLNMCLPFLCKFYKHFLIFWAVELRNFIPPEILMGCLVCVICNSSSFHSFTFKRSIMIVLTLNMYTLYLRTFDNICVSVQLRNCYVTYCCLLCVIWM